MLFVSIIAPKTVRHFAGILTTLEGAKSWKPDREELKKVMTKPGAQLGNFEGWGRRYSGNRKDVIKHSLSPSVNVLRLYLKTCPKPRRCCAPTKQLNEPLKVSGYNIYVAKLMIVV